MGKPEGTTSTTERKAKVSRVAELEKALRESDERLRLYDLKWSEQRMVLEEQLMRQKLTLENVHELLEQSDKTVTDPVILLAKKVLAKHLAKPAAKA